MALIIVVFTAGWMLSAGGDQRAGAARNELSHFKCYQALGGGNPPFVVDLNAQFGIELDVQINEAEIICAPAEKTNVRPAPVDTGNLELDHLKCYNIPGTRKDTVGATVEMTNQFGIETFEVGPPKLLCVPSAKEVLP